MMKSEISSLAASTIIFAASAAFFLRLRRRSHPSRPSDSDEVELPENATVGTRGYRAIKPPLPYLKHFFKCMEDPCDKFLNPKGYIGLCISENRLVTDLIAERLMQASTANIAFSNSEVYRYNSFLGLPVVREAIAYFIAKRFYLNSSRSLTREEALDHINPLHVAVGSGCTALLNYLFYALGEKGDVCLIPSPCYAAFDDMMTIAGCIPKFVRMANPARGPSPGELDLALLDAQSKGYRVKFLLVANPNNPLGVIYQADVIRNAVQWARKRRLHTIIDEIFALSTHKPNHCFESVVRVLGNQLGNDVHMVWALSKDFGSSGFRVGCLYSQNEMMMQALANLNYFSSVSHPMQVITADILTDDKFVDSFLDAARGRLGHSYGICVRKLDEMVVPYFAADAGPFIYIDLSSLLPRKSFQGEADLCDLIMSYARVVLTPGESLHDSTPGLFRLCYACVAPEVLEIALERLSRLIAKIRRMDWSDLNESTLQAILG